MCVCVRGANDIYIIYVFLRKLRKIIMYYYFLIIIVQYLSVLIWCFNKQKCLIFYFVCLHITKIPPRNMINKRHFVFVRRETYLILPAGQASEELSHWVHREWSRREELLHSSAPTDFQWGVCFPFANHKRG